jgi:hypothetical protein
VLVSACSSADGDGEGDGGKDGQTDAAGTGSPPPKSKRNNLKSATPEEYFLMRMIFASYKFELSKMELFFVSSARDMVELYENRRDAKNASEIPLFVELDALRAKNEFPSVWLLDGPKGDYDAKERETQQVHKPNWAQLGMTKLKERMSSYKTTLQWLDPETDLVDLEKDALPPKLGGESRVPGFSLADEPFEGVPMKGSWIYHLASG